MKHDFVESPRDTLTRADAPSVLTVELARELYDRFAMGGWEPADAYGLIDRMLAQTSADDPDRDAKVDADLADPSKITTHERACELIDSLDHQIAQIDVQLEMARGEAARAPLSESRHIWMRRAAYAGAMKRNQRHRVMQRDKEIRGTQMAAQTVKDRTESISKQERLQAEAEARQAAKRAEALKTHARICELAYLRSLHKQFVTLALDHLPRETYDLLMEKAEEQRAAMKDEPIRDAAV